jgi:hypothetical protein
MADLMPILIEKGNTMINEIANLTKLENASELDTIEIDADILNASWCCDARFEDGMTSHCPACGENQI